MLYGGKERLTEMFYSSAGGKSLSFGREMQQETPAEFKDQFTAPKILISSSPEEVTPKTTGKREFVMG